MRFYLLIIISALLLSCSQVKNVKTYYENGNLLEGYTVLKSDPEVIHGVYRSYDMQGNLKESSYYENGLLHGKRNLFFSDGRQEVIETYVNGDFEGPYVMYYESGNKFEEGIFEANQRIGIWKYYWDRGGNPLKEEIIYEDNVENGPFKEYHPNGQLAAEGTYLNEFEHGLLKMWDSTGFLIKEIVYDNGRPIEYNEYTKED